MSLWRRSTADWLQRITLVAWTVALAWLMWGHHLPGVTHAGPPYQVFIRAELWPLIAGGLALLLPVVIAAVGRGVTGHGGGVQHWTCATLVLLPLLYIGTAPKGGLGAFALEQRFISGGVATFANGPSIRRGPGKVPGGETTLLDVVMSPEQYDGTEVTLVGRISKSDKWPDEHMMLFRFVVVCCAADARPVGVLVHGDQFEDVADDAWLEVRGMLRIAQFDATDELVVDAREIKRIDPPARPYLYPF